MMTTDRADAVIWWAGRYTVVVVFILVQGLLAVSDSLITDEPRHLRDGATMLEEGRIDVNPEHPPMVKLLSAALMPGSVRRAALSVSASEPDPMTADARFAVASRLDGVPLLRVRLVPIAIAVLGLLAFGSIFESRDRRTGFWATLLLAASWPYLAHGHYVATDVAPVAFCLIATAILVRPCSPGKGALAGICLAAALVSKFSAPFLVAFLAILGWRRLSRAAFLTMTAVMLVGAWGVESYAVRNMSDDQLRGLADRAFSMGGLEGGLTPVAPALAALSRKAAGLSRPLGAYAIGFLDVSHRNAASPEFDYWAGRIVEGSQPLYPLATLAVKNDLPFLVLAMAGLILFLRSRPRPRVAGLGLAAAAFYLVLACAAHMHYGVRHLLFLVMVLAGLGTWAVAGVRTSILPASLVLAHVGAAVLAFPHYVSARNSPSSLILGEALYDYGDDWGQDLRRELRFLGRPVKYESLLVYRKGNWKALYPGLRSPKDGGDGPQLWIADRLLVDLDHAQRRSPRLTAGAAPLAEALRHLTEPVAGLERWGRPVSGGEPTFMAYEIPAGSSVVRVSP